MGDGSAALLRGSRTARSRADKSANEEETEKVFHGEAGEDVSTLASAKPSTCQR